MLCLQYFHNKFYVMVVISCYKWVKKYFKLWIQIRTNNNLLHVIYCENIIDVTLLKKGQRSREGESRSRR